MPLKSIFWVPRYHKHVYQYSFPNMNNKETDGSLQAPPLGIKVNVPRKGNPKDAFAFHSQISIYDVFQLQVGLKSRN